MFSFPALILAVEFSYTHNMEENTVWQDAAEVGIAREDGVFESKFQIAVHIRKASILFGAMLTFRVVGKSLTPFLDLEKLSL